MQERIPHEIAPLTPADGGDPVGPMAVTCSPRWRRQPARRVALQHRAQQLFEIAEPPRHYGGIELEIADLARQPLDLLRGVAEADGERRSGRAQRLQAAVVVAAAIAQPPAPGVEAEQRDEQRVRPDERRVLPS